MVLLVFTENGKKKLLNLLKILFRLFFFHFVFVQQKLNQLWSFSSPFPKLGVVKKSKLWAQPLLNQTRASLYSSFLKMSSGTSILAVFRRFISIFTKNG